MATETDSIARRLRHAMVREGLNQEALAEELNVSQSTISMWVRGLQKPTGIYRHIVVSWLDKVEDGVE